MDVVVNRHHCGFELSKNAFIEVMRRKGRAIEARTDKWPYDYSYYEDGKEVYQCEFTHCHTFRADPDLVAVVREMGDAANGKFAKLEVVTIPDDVEWTIEEYDGAEWVAEVHRTW